MLHDAMFDFLVLAFSCITVEM